MLSESGTRLWEEQHYYPYQKRAVKCQLAFWPEDYVNHLRLVYTARYVERKPGLNKSQGCWCCIILFYPWISTYNQKYKRPFQTNEDGPVIRKTGSPVSFLTLFSGWIPILGVEARHVYFLALASKTHERGSPRRGTLHYSSGRRWPT